MHMTVNIHDSLQSRKDSTMLQIKGALSIRWLFLLLILPLLIGGCAAKQKNVTFTAIIESVTENSLLVTTSDPVGFDKASIGLGDTKPDFQPAPGQKVEITIRPEIMESYPVQAFAVKIRLIADGN